MFPPLGYSIRHGVGRADKAFWYAQKSVPKIKSNNVQATSGCSSDQCGLKKPTNADSWATDRTLERDNEPLILTENYIKVPNVPRTGSAALKA